TEESAPLRVSYLPQRFTCGSPGLNLVHAPRAHGLDPPPALFRRHRAGVEQLFAEMAREYIDGRRLEELVRVLDRERIVTGTSSDNRDVLPARGTDDASELAAVGTCGQERTHQ